MKEIPIWEKANLTLEEAAAYSGMGQFLSVDEDWFGWYPAVLYYCIKIWYRIYCGFTFVF